MRMHRLQTENRVTELEAKISVHERMNMENEAEKARHFEEKEEVWILVFLYNSYV